MSLKYSAIPVGEWIAICGLSETNLAVGKIWNPNVRMQTETERAFAWADNFLTHINVGACYNSQAMGVGEGNIIVGIATNPNKWGVFGWAEENGVVTRLDGLGGTNVQPAATNGKVHCGQANLPNRITRAVKWENGQCIDLGTLGGPGAVATAINNKNNIVGSSRESNSSTNMAAFIVKDGKMTALPKVNSGKRSFAYGINDNDDVVGMGIDGWTAVKWVNADKPIVLYNGQSQAFDINNNGLVVGAAGNPAFAFVHDGKALHNLNEITEGLEGVSLNVARSINNQGCITAYGHDSKYRLKGFLLIPV